MQVSTNSKLNIAFVAALIAVILFGAIAMLALQRSNQSTKWLLHTNEVMEKIEHILIISEKIETGQRGYLLTSQEEFLIPYYEATAFSEDQFYRLEELINDNPEQQARLKEIHKWFLKKREISEQTIQLVKQGKRDEAIAIVASGVGIRTMNELRKHLSDMEDAEQLLFRERVQNKENSNQTTAFFMLLGTLVASGVVLLALRTVQKDIRAREALQADLITAREAALEASRMKSEFLANMSHEIRTPMNGVIGMTGLLLDTKLNSQQKDFAETIRGSADSLLTIINDILDFSKIEAGKLEIELADFDVRGVIDGCTELLLPQAMKKGVEVNCFIEPSISNILIGDSGRIRQTLMNLLGNAIKFTHAGEIQIQVLLDSETADHAKIKFEIADTGIGISTEQQAKLFNAFSQADGSTARKYGGTGLGLVISKNLTTLMGGEMGFSSQFGEGSKFWFTLNLEKSKNQKSISHKSGLSLKGLRCLIIDDNETNQKVIHAQINSWEMKSVRVSNPTDALKMLRREAEAGTPYDLVLLDMQLPEMSGLDLAKKIKADPLICETKLILMSSVELTGVSTELKEAGILTCLMKPVEQSLLYNSLVQATLSGESFPSSIKLSNPRSHVESTRILIAEDNPVNRKIALMQLEKMGYRPDAVANGIEALEATLQVPYDLILMDCQMPEMDGYQATMQLRKREAGRRHTVVIAMTANALEGDREKCLAAGMDDYVGKPVKVNVLQRVLETWSKKIHDAA